MSLTDAQKTKYRMDAIATFNDIRRYEKLILEADDMDEHELWVHLRDSKILRLQLLLSALEEVA